MRKFFLSTLCFLPTFTFASGIYNPGSGSGGGGGGSSALEVLFGVSRTSPTATIKATSPDFTGSVSGSTITLTLSPTQSTINTFSSSITVNNTAGLSIATVISASSMTVSTISVSGSISIDNNQMLTHGAGASTKYVFQVPDSQSLWVGPNQNIQSVYGTFGTFLGAGAGIQGAAGGFSTGVGNGALASLSSGAESSGFGYGACAALIDGSYNTCFGANSGASNVSASRTINVGMDACYYNTVDDTTCIGYNSGLPGGSATNQTTGLRNTLIGNFTGHSGGQWTGGGALGYGSLMRGDGQFQMGGAPGSGFEFRTVMTSATIDSGATVNGQLKSMGGVFISTSPIVRSTYTLTSADSVILASAAPNGLITMQMLAAASTNGGQIFSISKIDKSTGIVKVQLNGTDLINATTGTLYLDAPGQYVELQSNGVDGYIARHAPVTSGYLGDTADPNGGSAVSVLNDARCQVYTNTDFGIGTSVRFAVGAQSGNMDVGLYDKNGVRLASSGSTAVPAVGVAGINFTGKAYMSPGPVWICLAADNTTATFRCPSSSDIVGTCEIATAFPLPATLAIPGCTAAAKKFAMIATLQGGPQN